MSQNKYEQYMKGVNLMRAGLTFVALMVYALYVPKLVQQGDLAFGQYFFMMLFGVVLFGALVVWDLKTAGRQSVIVLLVVIVIVIIATNTYRGLNPAGMDEFIASLRAVGLVVITALVSLALHYTATGKPAPSTTESEEPISTDDMTVTRAQATEAPATL